MTVVRLQHASVQVPRGELDRAVDFYGRVLGMIRVPNLAGLAWFAFGDGDHVHLLEGPGAPDSRGHLALQVEALEPVLAEVRASGQEPEPGRELWGEPRWFVRDPAGNLVELFETPPPA
jgi:catechol 2,3-dioxygenase-like lactoylglutathione lyase family enzyme